MFTVSFLTESQPADRNTEPSLQYIYQTERFTQYFDPKVKLDDENSNFLTMLLLFGGILQSFQFTSALRQINTGRASPRFGR